MMHIGEVLNIVYDDDIGWRPSSGAIKPVHVANGLVGAVQGACSYASDVNRVVVWGKPGKMVDERRSFEALAEGPQAERYGELAHAQRDFERARRYALGLLGADKALFPSAENSSFSLT